MRYAMLALVLLASAPPSSSQTAYTYEYDIYGRLIRVERNSGASSRVRYFYDGADNRTKVKQGASAPDAVYDYALIDGTFGDRNVYPLDNDTDADLPFDTLTITGVSGTGSGYASIQGGGTHIYVGAPAGYYSWSYTIQDADGNTDSGTLNVEVYEFTCGEYEC